jgi:hypothetical protein
VLNLEEITKTHVRAALREWTRRTPDAFRDHFGINGKARRFFVLHQGPEADMKAIVAAAAILAGQRRVRSTDVHSHRAHARLTALGFALRPEKVR